MVNLPFSSASDITYVALAATLLPSDLQPQASAAGLCHVRMTEYTVAEQRLVQVAALPHRLNEDTACPRVFTLWVDMEQLAHVLPWDQRLQGIPTCDVRECLQARAYSRGASDIYSDVPEVPESKQQPEQEGPAQPHETTTLIPLPELFVSCQTVNETVADSSEPSLAGSPSRLASWTRLVWLRAALAMVRRQMRHTRQLFFKLDTLLDKVIAVQRRLHQSLVSASAVYIGEKLVGWRLKIALPMVEVLV